MKDSNLVIIKCPYCINENIILRFFRATASSFTGDCENENCISLNIRPDGVWLYFNKTKNSLIYSAIDDSWYVRIESIYEKINSINPIEEYKSLLLFQ